MREAHEIVAELVSTGLDHRQTLLLLELVSATSTRLSGGSRVESPDDASERRREWDRKYRRKRRLEARLLSTSSSTRQSTRQVDERCDLSSSSFVAEPLKEASRKERTVVVEGQKVSRGTRLNADSQLSEDGLAFAIECGMTRERALQAWAEFVDYWIAIPGQRGCKINWESTWRNRVRELTGKGGKNGHRGPRPFQDDSRSLTRAADRLIERAEKGEFSFGPRPGLSLEKSEADVRLLPKG